MDFVDLDKVLDEFEEEEKQALSIVPGQELKPSGYLEFLERHQEQEWALINPNGFSSTSGYTLERRSAREPVDVPYDDPYDNFSTYKFGFMTNSQHANLSLNISDRLPKGKIKRNQSAIVTSLTRISPIGDDINTVYTTPAKFNERKGIANCSERKGTISYQQTGVQTDALSPISEQELLSSPFPRSNILVDGHGDTELLIKPILLDDSLHFNEVGQNYTPLHTGIATVDLINRETETRQLPSSSTGIINENQTQKATSRILEGMDIISNLISQFSPHFSVVNSCESGSEFSLLERSNPITNSTTEYNIQSSIGNFSFTGSPAEETLAFPNTSDEVLDESVVNIYPHNDEHKTPYENATEIPLSINHYTSYSQDSTTHDIQNYAYTSPAVNSYIRESVEDPYFTSQQKPFLNYLHCHIVSGVSDGEFYSYDQDVASDSGVYSQSENFKQFSDKLGQGNSVSNVGHGGGVTLFSEQADCSYVEPSDKLISPVEPSDRITSHVEPRDKLISHVEPSDKLISHVEPSDREVSHVEPIDKAISHVEPSDNAISHVEPSDRAISHGEPSDKAISHVEPSDKAISHVEPSDKAVSHVEPSDMAISHVEPSDMATSHVEPSDGVISHVEPSDRATSHGEPSDKALSHVEPSDRATSHVEPSEMIISYTEHCDQSISSIDPSDRDISYVEPVVDRQILYNCLINGRMEIETILDDMEKLELVTSIGQPSRLEQPCPERFSLSSELLTSSHIKPNLAHVPDANEGRPIEAMFLATDSNSVSPVHNSSFSHSHENDSAGMSGVAGARPKDPSAIKTNRPNSLLGLSKIRLDLSAVIMPEVTIGVEDTSVHEQTADTNAKFSRAALQLGQTSCNIPPQAVVRDFETVCERWLDSAGTEESRSRPLMSDLSEAFSEIQTDQDKDQSLSEENVLDMPQDEELLKMKRPALLNLPGRTDISAAHTNEEDIDHEVKSENAEEETTDSKPGMDIASTGVDETSTTLHYAVTPQGSLGLVAPFWIPDADAQSCMICQTRFTMWKRRHHCRACGQVLCAVCCSQKTVLPYMENKEARVCVECHIQLSLVPNAIINLRYPNPNNPNEYCSKVPPNQQASSHTNPPVVLVPTGVLKISGSQKQFVEPKQVMFSDGIRPGGDLTILDDPKQTPSFQDQVRTSKKHQTSAQTLKLKEDSLARSQSLIPKEGLPPLLAIQSETGCEQLDKTCDWADYMTDYKSEEGPLVTYMVNKNLAVGVKIINLDCCMSRVCWCFVTRGMETSGQSELVVLLELTEDELSSQSLIPPREMFLHFQAIYEEALKGTIIQDMGYFIFHHTSMQKEEYGGFLFLQPTFQCLMKLPLLDCPYLFGILIKKGEVPWARVFPIRLMLRLGAEYRYYPSPLISMRNRKPVYFELGHTIINLLADFHNFRYMLPQIRGLTISMENQKTVISFPRNKYNDVMKALRNSNEHVMALGSSFSSEVDSHLVCIQSDDGNYQTQAINIQNKPRLVTGASFVVFNGALKLSSGLHAKSSIVEDGLMVQILPEVLASIKQALKKKVDYVIECGPVEPSSVFATVELRWVENNSYVNMREKSDIDGTSLEGIERISVKCPSDYLGDILAIRWTHVYFLKHQDLTPSNFGSEDMSQLMEEIAHACCSALIRHLNELKTDDKVKLGLRVDLTSESIGYEIGSKGQSLPVAILNDLDTYLVPVIHRASEKGVVLEFIFHIVE